MKQKLRFLMMTLLCAVVSTAWGADTWVKTTPSSLQTGDIVVIVDQSSKRAMSNDNGTGSAPSAISVTLKDDKSEISSEVNANIQWEVTVSNGTYKFGAVNTNNYLYCTNTNNGVRVGTNSNNVFTWKKADANSEEYYLFNSATSRYIGVYENQDWRCYNTVNNNIKATVTAFYKKTSSQGPTTPNIAISSETVEVGKTINIIVPSDLTSVEYESDDPSIASVDEDGEITGNSVGSAEITVTWAAVNGVYNAGEKTFSITVTAPVVATVYEEVTSTNQLVAGNEYILVATENSVAMGAPNAGNNKIRDKVDVIIQNNQVSITNQEVTKLTLGGVSGAWTFYASDTENYLALNGNSNEVHSAAEVNDNSKWTITSDFQLCNTSQADTRYIMYNSSSPRFACYKSGQKKAVLFVKEGSSTSTEPSITVNTTSIDIPAEGADGTIEVTFTNVDPELTEVVFYDADGTTETTCDWIAAEINGNNIEYLVDENEGEARTAYFKVYGLDNDGNNVYSELITITQAAAPAPSISVASTNVELTAAAGDGSIEVTYTRTEPYDVAFYEEDGETAAEYDWIEADFDESNNIYYIVEENTSNEARTAYLKIVALGPDGDDLIYSDLITITQAAPVVDYATLPFEFDGKKADIEGTDGLTQVGLGSDYKNSPYLKLDGAGDYVILHFDERPGTLTFDIKGNPGSGSSSIEGEFVVQTSEDGNTFTDLKSYTTLGNTILSEEFNNLGENVRYIKWIYKERTSGNVALGNITLEKYGIDPELTISDVNTTINTDETLEISTLSEGEIEFDIENDDVCSISKQGDVYWLYASSAAGTTTVTATQAAFGEYKSASVTFTVTVIDPEAKTHVYKKVTNTKDITSGRYLIVYEGSKVAFDGSLETLDAAENITDVEINNGVITLDEDKDVFYFNIDVNAGTIKSASGNYIGSDSYANGLDQSDSPEAYGNHTFSIDGGNAVITYKTTGGDMTMRYNYGDNQLRFRYYKSGQQPIQLYKFDGFAFTISKKATDGTYYYATISNLGEGNFKVEGNVTARTVCVDEEGELTDLSVFGEGDVLPGNGAYLVDGAVYGDYAFPATEEACEETDLGENMLISTGEKGLSKDEMIAAAQAHYNNTQGEYKFYKLSLNKGSDIGSVGFYWGNSNGEAFQYKKGHQAFLAVPLTEEGTGSQVAAYLFNGDKTGIYNVLATEVENENDATYSISGIRMENKQLPKGIYIKNGKKVVVR